MKLDLESRRILVTNEDSSCASTYVAIVAVGKAVPEKAVGLIFLEVLEYVVGRRKEAMEKGSGWRLRAFINRDYKQQDLVSSWPACRSSGQSPVFPSRMQPDAENVRA